MNALSERIIERYYVSEIFIPSESDNKTHWYSDIEKVKVDDSIKSFIFSV